MSYVGELLLAAGIETRTLATRPGRPNLMARVAGNGQAPPLLLHAHVDVVPTTGQSWSHPPFEGLIVDDQVFGRGALDMKGELAMMLAAILRIRAEGAAPAGDVLLAVVADEEAGSDAGAGFLVREHPELFSGVRYAVGEDGGVSLGLGNSLRFYPIVVGEKRDCWLRLTLRGPSGHASRPTEAAAATAKLGRLLTALGNGLLGPHRTSAVERMIAELIRAVPEPFAGCLAKVRDDPGNETALADLPPADSRYMQAVLHHTINPTVIRAGHKTNVIPGEITVELDARLLPGDFPTDRFIVQLRGLIGEEVDIEITHESAGVPSAPTGPFYEVLADVIREHDPQGVPVPMVATASTDAQLFGSLGLSCYGWIPLRLPPGAEHRGLLHCADERVPVDALRFGAECFRDLLLRFR